MTNQEYNLTIMDIDWEDGNLYETKSGEKFLVLHNALTHYDIPHFKITDAYLLKDILNKKFRKIIDWSKVPVDTKILIRYREDYAWERRYFAEYDDGEIYILCGQNQISWFDVRNIPNEIDLMTDEEWDNYDPSQENADAIIDIGM